jgi:uncharacterized low-complexity protein
MVAVCNPETNMKSISRIQSLAGATVLAALALPMAVHAESNPFQSADIAGFQLADAGKAEGKCGEGKCGGKKDGSKPAEGKCGEGKCGGKKGEEKSAEGKCGEGKCGGAK